MNTQPFLENAEDLYQNAPFGYMTVRADGLIVNVNATLLKWLGYEWEEILLQKSFQDLLDMGGKIYFETHMMPMLLMQGEISEINIELKGKASIKLPTLVNASRIHDQSALETYFRFSILDITQRKSYELELIKARQEAEQTIQRLKQINAELEQFASIASHDLQAPLRTISGLIGLSEKKGHFPVDSEVTKYFSLIKRNAQRMKLMIGDLLEYARIDSEELPFEEFSLNEACEIGLEMIDDQVKESNAVITIPELPMVIGNKLQLARLFQNLFGNSIKYRSESDPVIRVAFEEKNDEIRVFVKDNGMGFEEDLADQVFGFMKRLHSHDSIPGTGIGLSACKRILAIHGGTIGATSEPGKGSTFYFTLPNLNMKPNI